MIFENSFLRLARMEEKSSMRAFWRLEAVYLSIESIR